MSLSVLPRFYSKSFMVSRLVYWSLIHFEFIFVNGAREYSKFILLHLAVQFSQHHILEIIFPLLYILASFVIDQLIIGAWFYLWTFYLVTLIYISIFVSVSYCFDYFNFVLQSEVRSLISIALFFSLKTALALWSFFVFPYKPYSYFL